MIVAFDAQAHAYTVDGRPVPGVTSILKAIGLIDTSWSDPAAMERGTFVHDALSIDWNGGRGSDLDEARTHPWVLAHVEGFRKFQREMGVEIIANEQRVHHPHLRFAGTLDWLIRREGRIYVVDVKTGSPAAWHFLQTAAYAMAYAATAGLGQPTPARAALYLDDESRYRWAEHKDRNDFEVWKAALTLAAWKETHA